MNGLLDHYDHRRKRVLSFERPQQAVVTKHLSFPKTAHRGGQTDQVRFFPLQQLGNLLQNADLLGRYLQSTKRVDMAVDRVDRPVVSFQIVDRRVLQIDIRPVARLVQRRDRRARNQHFPVRRPLRSVLANGQRRNPHVNVPNGENRRHGDQQIAYGHLDPHVRLAAARISEFSHSLPSVARLKIAVLTETYNRPGRNRLYAGSHELPVIRKDSTRKDMRTAPPAG